MIEEDNNVLIPKKFRDRMSESQLQNLGEFARMPDSEIDLKHPAPDEKVIGTLEQEEIDLYKEMFMLQERLDKLNGQLGGTALIAAGEALKEGHEPPSTPEDVLDESIILEYFSVLRQFDFVKALLWEQITFRLGSPDWVLGVRSRWRVVKVSRRW